MSIGNDERGQDRPLFLDLGPAPAEWLARWDACPHKIVRPAADAAELPQLWKSAQITPPLRSPRLQVVLGVCDACGAPVTCTVLHDPERNDAGLGSRGWSTPWTRLRRPDEPEPVQPAPRPRRGRAGAPAAQPKLRLDLEPDPVPVLVPPVFALPADTGPAEGVVAQRDWLVRARVRVLVEHSSRPPEHPNPSVFEVGQVVELIRYGRRGEPVQLRHWWTNKDPGVSRTMPPEKVEVLWVEEYHPPTWPEAAMSIELATSWLVEHHENAAWAVAAWQAQGLHLSLTERALEIRTAAPELRLVGRVRRNYWHRTGCHRQYEAVFGDDVHDRVPLERLPADPVLVAQRASEAREQAEGRDQQLS